MDYVREIQGQDFYARYDVYNRTLLLNTASYYLLRLCVFKSLSEYLGLWSSRARIHVVVS